MRSIDVLVKSLCVLASIYHSLSHTHLERVVECHLSSIFHHFIIKLRAWHNTIYQAIFECFFRIDDPAFE